MLSCAHTPLSKLRIRRLSVQVTLGAPLTKAGFQCIHSGTQSGFLHESYPLINAFGSGQQKTPRSSATGPSIHKYEVCKLTPQSTPHVRAEYRLHSAAWQPPSTPV